jgi:hypothetical protein
MKNIRNYIKDHGIMCWLHVKQQVRRQYGSSARILYRCTQLSYFDFECAMCEWYEL